MSYGQNPYAHPVRAAAPPMAGPVSHRTPPRSAVAPTSVAQAVIPQPVNPQSAFPQETIPHVVPYAIPALATDAGIWRDGKYLVMHKQATLPDICIKSGEPANGYRMKRKLVWHPPLLLLTLPLGVIPSLILLLIMEKSAKISFGLSLRYRQQRRKRMAAGWSGALLMLVSTILAMKADLFGLSLLGVVGFIIALFTAFKMGQIIAPHRINKHYVWLRGVNEELLSALPPMPH